MSQLVTGEEHKTQTSQMMRIFRILLIIALVILLVVLAKMYLWPLETVKVGGLFSPSSINLTAMSAFGV